MYKMKVNQINDYSNKWQLNSLNEAKLMKQKLDAQNLSLKLSNPQNYIWGLTIRKLSISLGEKTSHKP